MITYKKMSLFDAPLGSVLVHAVNCRGQFRSGIAAEFKAKFPQVYELYLGRCLYGPSPIGTCLLGSAPRPEYLVANLFTSVEESANKDPEETILVNTVLALNDLLKSCRYETFYSCKFNSGHFGVPWEKTESIIKILTERYNVDWVVCEI